MSGGVFITHPLALHTSTCSSHLHRTESESCTFVQVALLCRNFDNFSGVIFDKRSIVADPHIQIRVSVDQYGRWISFFYNSLFPTCRCSNIIIIRGMIRNQKLH